MDNLRKLHKINIKKLMPKMSPLVKSELLSNANKVEEVVLDLVLVHVQEVVNSNEVLIVMSKLLLVTLGEKSTMRYTFCSLLLKILY